MLTSLFVKRNMEEYEASKAEVETLSSEAEKLGEGGIVKI